MLYRDMTTLISVGAITPRSSHRPFVPTKDHHSEPRAPLSWAQCVRGAVVFRSTDGAGEGGAVLHVNSVRTGFGRQVCRSACFQRPGCDFRDIWRTACTAAAWEYRLPVLAVRAPCCTNSHEAAQNARNKATQHGVPPARDDRRASRGYASYPSSAAAQKFTNAYAEPTSATSDPIVHFNQGFLDDRRVSPILWILRCPRSASRSAKSRNQLSIHISRG